MIEIPVLDTSGKKISSEQLDPALLGGRVRHKLLKQAVVAYRANQRLGTSATKSRGMVAGSTRKIYRQKGTGRARMGPVRTPVRVGGGRAFAKIPRDFSQKLPHKMRRLARNSAVLAKALAGEALIVDGIAMEAPKTKKLVGILRATQADRGALLAVAAADAALLLSGRNIQGFAIKTVRDLNAYDVLRARKLVFTPDGFRALVADASGSGQVSAA